MVVPSSRSQPLSAALTLRTGRPPAGSVVVQNHASTELRIWDMGNTWGDDALSFEVTAGGQSATVKKRPQRYTRNVPSVVVLAPGGQHEIPFDFGDGTWDLESH